jgi:hypothetical protein
MSGNLDDSRRLTPDEIQRVWARFLPPHDSILSLKAAKQFLLEGKSEEALYQNTFAAFEARRKDQPDFFEGGLYDWVLEPSSYSLPIEAAYQVRCLDAVIGLWRAGLEPPEQFRERMGRIVARTTFSPDFNTGTPSTRRRESIDFVVCPLAWANLCDWYFSGFANSLVDNAAVSTDTDAWLLLQRDSVQVDDARASRYWTTILAHVIAGLGCPEEILLPQAISAIADRVPEFSCLFRANADAPRPQLAGDMSYLAVEMALAHEVGHIFVGDHNENNPDELAADNLALGSFVNSWGWRAWLLEGSGLSDHGKTVAGALPLQNVLLSGTAVRLLVAKRLNLRPSLQEDLRLTLEAVGLRAERSNRALENHLGTKIRSGLWPERASDENINLRLAKALQSYLSGFLMFVKNFPSGAVRAAFQTAEAQRDSEADPA